MERIYQRVYVFTNARSGTHLPRDKVTLRKRVGNCVFSTAFLCVCRALRVVNRVGNRENQSRYR